MASRTLTDQQRGERRERERELVRSSIEQLRSSDGWRQWLKARARFGRYSVRNQLLIANQHPSATKVAGFRAWLALGYCVSKGERAIRIWAPCPPSKTKLDRWQQAGADPTSKPRTGWRLTAVFAQDQITALPPPSVPAPLDAPIAAVLGDSHAHLVAPLQDLAGELGYTVSFEAIDRSDGYCHAATRKIAVAERLSPNARVATLVHELAHALAHADREHGDPALTYAQSELVAESVSFTCCRSAGLQTAENSIPYLAGWAERAELDALEQTAKLTDRLAERIEIALAKQPLEAQGAMSRSDEDAR